MIHYKKYVFKELLGHIGIGVVLSDQFVGETIQTSSQGVKINNVLQPFHGILLSVR